jgi:hypothetical protein
MKKLLLTAMLASMVAISGTVIADDAPTMATMVLEGQMTGTKPVGMVPDGIRIDGFTSGVFTEGILAGATADWVDYLLVRHDGVGVIDVRGYIVDPDGVPVSFTVRGFLGEPSGLHEAMLDPDFELPDVDVPTHGAAWFESMAPQYAFLNYTVFGVTGFVNAFQGMMRLTFRPIAE